MSIIVKDLLTNEDILLKTKEYSNCTFYSNRRNLVKHFQNISTEEIVKITKDILIDRINKKKIKYIPCTIECKSFAFPCPSPALIESLHIRYNDIGNDLNLKSRFKYTTNFRLKKELVNDIITDSREQKPLKFSSDAIINGLPFGDYKSKNNDKVVVERKSGSDFISTISKGFERFCRELSKAKEAKCNIVMVVENKLSDMLSFNYLPQYKWSKATPAFIFSRLRTLFQEFDNFQAIFCDNREDCQYITHLLLTNPNLYDYDLQYLKDLKLLNK